jgi:hypothetical protein
LTYDSNFQLVNDEEYVGTLLEANEKIVEAIQLYDKVSSASGHGNRDESADLGFGIAV